MTNIAVLNSQLFTWDVSLAALAVRPSAIVKICKILGAIWRVHLLGVFVANGFCCSIGSLEGSPTVLYICLPSLLPSKILDKMSNISFTLLGCLVSSNVSFIFFDRRNGGGRSPSFLLLSYMCPPVFAVLCLAVLKFSGASGLSSKCSLEGFPNCCLHLIYFPIFSHWCPGFCSSLAPLMLVSKRFLDLFYCGMAYSQRKQGTHTSPLCRKRSIM